METRDKELPFLDILIKRNDDKIWRDIYCKPTDTRRYHLLSSTHPNNCKKNIIYSSTENLYHSEKSTTEIKASIGIKAKPKNISLPRHYNNKWCKESPRNSLKRTSETKRIISR